MSLPGGRASLGLCLWRESPEPFEAVWPHAEAEQEGRGRGPCVRSGCLSSLETGRWRMGHSDRLHGNIGHREPMALREALGLNR